MILAVFNFVCYGLLLVLSLLDKIKISLEGSRCAGVVQYAIDEKTPPGYFCADSWGKS